MKLRNIFAVVAAAATVTAFAAGCSDSPSDVMENYISDVQKGEVNYETFEKYFENKHHAEMKKAFQDKKMWAEFLEYSKKSCDGVKVVDEKIDGDKATVTIGKDGKKHDVRMIKEDGVWKLDSVL